LEQQTELTAQQIEPQQIPEQQKSLLQQTSVVLQQLLPHVTWLGHPNAEPLHAAKMAVAAAAAPVLIMKNSESRRDIELANFRDNLSKKLSI
jgi:hypothetical protein